MRVWSPRSPPPVPLPPTLGGVRILRAGVEVIIYAEGSDGTEENVAAIPGVPVSDLPQPSQEVVTKLRIEDAARAVEAVAKRGILWDWRTESGWEIWRGEEKEGSIRLLTGR